jgi:hypothetical protein
VLDVVRPELNKESLNENLVLSRKLSGKVLELDPNMERSVKLK